MREYFCAKFNLVNALRGELLFISKDVAEAAEEYGMKMPAFAKIPADMDPSACPKPFDTSVQSRNFAMAAEFLKSLGLPYAAAEAARGFALPKYRFGEPAEASGVKFYNDSKATNAHAAIAALRELSGTKSLVWLGGGKDKNCDLSELAGEIAKSAKGAVLIGRPPENSRKSCAPAALSARLRLDERGRGNVRKNGGGRRKRIVQPGIFELRNVFGVRRPREIFSKRSFVFEEFKRI